MSSERCARTSSMTILTHLLQVWCVMAVVTGAIAGPEDFAPEDQGLYRFFVDGAAYDVDKLIPPKFINTDYIDLSKITQISKFRSGAGHDYKDSVESCRSMKHYFVTLDPTTQVRAPVAGTIMKLQEEHVGIQPWIQADVAPSFAVALFHVIPAKPLKLGMHVEEGELLGFVAAPDAYSDIAIIANIGAADRLVSYFDVISDEVFARYKARGFTSRSDFIFTKVQRDAAPLKCNGEAFVTISDPKIDMVTLSKGTAQTITVNSGFQNVRAGDAPKSIDTTATSGLAVRVSSATPAVCSVAGTKATWRIPGKCSLLFNQDGNTQFLPAALAQVDVTVLPSDALNMGLVYSSAQSDLKSFVRLSNTGTTASTVTVSLFEPSSGTAVGSWTSPVIAAGAAPQIGLDTIENNLSAAIPRADIYTLKIRPAASEFMAQNILWRPSAGTLTNLSTCETGVTASSTQLIDVHSSLLDGGYPSVIAVTNAGTAAASAQLGLYDAATGTKLGTYATVAIAANGHARVPISTIETGAKVTPGLSTYHYVIKLEGTFTGYLQHLVTNTQAGVVTDMTESCALTPTIPSVTGKPRMISVYSTAQTGVQSYLRFNNGGTIPGHVKITLAADNSGVASAEWTSPAIGPGASRQFSIGEIEKALNVAGVKPTAYTALVRPYFAGYLQHVLFRPTDGTLTNLSTCDGGVTAISGQLINVHSSLLDGGYPSAIVVTNTAPVSSTAVLGLYDATTGIKLGAMTTSDIKASAQLIMSVSTIETAANVSPGNDIYHYNIKFEAPFNGYLQHRMTNKKAGVTSDLTAVCKIDSVVCERCGVSN